MSPDNIERSASAEHEVASRPLQKPPGAPWVALVPQTPGEGYFSYYYADNLSLIAARAVTKIRDNKSDPNIETGTYGLFSTCSHSMRASVARRGVPYIFFVASHRGERWLTGFYEIGWYAKGPLVKIQADYALAAKKVHFIAPGLRAADLPRGVREQFAARWRLTKRVSAPHAEQLLKILKTFPDATADYIREVRRLERFNRYLTGFAYVNWRREQGFAWEDAEGYLANARVVATSAPNNSAQTNSWNCGNCAKNTENKALLKRCPWCGALGSLQPA